MWHQLFHNKLVHPWLGEHLCGFPSICPAVLENKIFFIAFLVNPIWLLNHVNYDIIYVNLLFLMDRWSYVWSFASICLATSEKIFEGLKNKKTKIWLPNHVTDDINVFFLFCGSFYHLGIKWSTENLMTSSVTWFGSHIVKKIMKKPSKIFTEVAEQIEVKLYRYDYLSMRNKRFAHMLSEVTWFGSYIGLKKNIK